MDAIAAFIHEHRKTILEMWAQHARQIPAASPLGRTELEKVIATMRDWLARELADWGADDDAQLRAALGALAQRLVDDDPQLPPLPPQPMALSGSGGSS